MPESASKIEFFNSYFELLESEGIAHVILHTYEHYPERLHSDVDYCVADENLHRMIPLIYTHCANAGWRLVQIMQHEVKAFFCICVSRQDPSVYVELDVCSHYMRKGKVLIKADDLLKERRKLCDKCFYVPAVAVEFCYSLWKSVAKRKPIEAMFKRLGDLYDSDPVQCREVMQTMHMISGKDSFRSWEEDGKFLHKKLDNVYQNQSVDYRRGQIGKWLTRVEQPTGLYVSLSRDLYEIDRKSIIRQLSPYFRSARVQNSSRISPRVYKDILRSTLVVSVQSNQRCDILALLASTQQAVLQIENTDQSRVVEDVLDYLGSRLVKRYGINV